MLPDHVRNMNVLYTKEEMRGIMKNHHFDPRSRFPEKTGDMKDWAKEYEQLLLGLRIREDDCDESLLAHHLPFLERLDAVEGSSVALFDTRTRSYRFLTSSFKFLGGYPRGEALSEGPDYFFRLMHAPDIPFVLETIVRTFRFLFALEPGERKDYKLSFEFRIRAASGDLVRILQQIVALELDRRGNIWLVLIANDLAPKGPGEGLERELRNIRTGSLHLFPRREPEEEKESLSRREIEILGLVAEGMASREIADRLFISVATVNNHRQRILQKLSTKTSAEAVRYAASRGLV
jgi:DNA-binding CsgD family transcriptional regulator